MIQLHKRWNIVAVADIPQQFTLNSDSNWISLEFKDAEKGSLALIANLKMVKSLRELMMHARHPINHAKYIKYTTNWMMQWL